MKIRDRIKELRRVRAGDLVTNPRNWRTHPEAQSNALRGVLAEVGFADALIAREHQDGRLMLLDGHLRAGLAPEQIVPVLVLDVNEEEGDKILATLDPLTAMAETDNKALERLLEDVHLQSAAVQKMLEDLAVVDRDTSHGDETTLRELNTRRPPQMSWVLIGIPAVRFSEISADIERVAQVPGIVCETTVNGQD